MKNRKKLEEAIGLINCVQDFLSKLLDNVDVEDDSICEAYFMFDSQLDSKKTFQNFIEGDNNKVARTIGLTIAEHPGQEACNPCFIYGPSGCGKTHLINAIGMACTEKHPQKQVMYASARELQRQYTYSVCKNMMDDFINYYQSADVLIIDDI